ncbi:protein transport protein Sec24p [Trichomonascus vanleenenianus]|uniref:protein transport protein Sec24p n=1 Tax=Trichomonascus vanleenenianus TaxID=2268995 RepID=UPI003EC9D180
MAQYGQQGYPGGEVPPQGPPQPHHSKRRAYPQAQYNFNAPPAAAPVAPAYPGMPQAPAPAPGQPAEGVFTPAGAPAAPSYGTDQLAGQFGAMGINDPRAAAPYGASTPPAGGEAIQLPLNQLYNIDLLHSLPAPITDLDLPPPPIVLPPDASVTHNNANANASPNYARSTLNVVPRSNALLKKSKLPFALSIHPYNALLNANEPIPVVSDTVICRCRRCRCYINPFVTFLEQSHRWKCNMCGLTNEVPTQFDWDPIKNEQQNRYARNEINYGVTEFVAPPEYMVRPPQPPVYVFVIDCSVNAVQNGLLATAARTIKDSLDKLPNKDGRTRVGFIAVDSALHYFSIPLPGSQRTEASLLVVSDLEDPFLPLPHSLLVNLTECRESVEGLLDSMGEMFANNVNSGSAIGSALVAANKLIGSIGGKIVCLTASMPNLGVAKLEMREDRKLAGTAKEHTLLQTANSFYKSFAVECNKSQVTVDMFLFSSQYQDVASLGNLPRFTGGQTHFYPGWSASRSEDAYKFAHELSEHLSMEISMEAVLRVRASTGLRMNTYYGNFFNRSSDLCSFPTFPRDQSYVIECSIEETITKPWVCFQAAILHTTCDGERRIRVINIALPTSPNLNDIYASADQLAIAQYYAHKAFEKTLSSGIQDAQDMLVSRLTDMLQTYKKELMTTNVGASAPLQFCANLRMLPLLINALMKHVALRKSSQIPSDLRSAALALLTTMPLNQFIKYIHPDFYALHEMSDEDGLVDPETGEIRMPPKLNLTAERISSYGLYLINDGEVQFLWVGRDAVPQLLDDAFGVSTLADVKGGKTELPELEGVSLNERIRAIIGKNRERKDAVTWPSLFVIKEDGDPALRLWASTFLIEDRTDQAMAYSQFLTTLRDKINS